MDEEFSTILAWKEKNAKNLRRKYFQVLFNPLSVFLITEHLDLLLQ